VIPAMTHQLVRLVRTRLERRDAPASFSRVVRGASSGNEGLKPRKLVRVIDTSRSIPKLLDATLGASERRPSIETLARAHRELARRANSKRRGK
jgi:hypothetical protein